mgnify:CR=1 FL=1
MKSYKNRQYAAGQNGRSDFLCILSQHGELIPSPTRTNSLLAKVLTIASSFFVPFVPELQGFTENYALNRES